MEPSRRAFLAAVGGSALAGCVSPFGGGSGTPTDTGGDPDQDTRTYRDANPASGGAIDQSRFAPDVADTRLHLPADRERLRELTVSSMAAKDDIPSIDSPLLVEPEEMSYELDDGDVVFGLDHGGAVRAYPQRILVYHEICNDVIDGETVSITYCPLTGTALGFDAGGTTFGVSGHLLNNNLVMYDRWTETWWPQILASSIPGPWNESPQHHSLREIPLVWTTWERWRTVHPDTRVLSVHTGHVANYDRKIDPYGSYNPRRLYYADDNLLYPPLHESDRFHPKRVVMGARTADGAAAFLKDALRERGVLTGTVGDRPIVAVYDPRLDTAYAYRNPEEKLVSLDGGRATLDGSGYEPDSLPLTRIHTFDAMWFAWYGLYPNTTVYE